MLREKAKALTKKDIASTKIKNLIKKMRATLAPEENGVAIAAPQVGESVRIFLVAGKVFDDENKNSGTERTKKSPDKVFVNPEIIRASRKKKSMAEGCLSVRDVYGKVMRHEKASVRALDEHGRSFTYHGSGLLAQIFQHETDHLNGILFIDKAETLDEPKK